MVSKNLVLIGWIWTIWLMEVGASEAEESGLFCSFLRAKSRRTRVLKARKAYCAFFDSMTLKLGVVRLNPPFGVGFHSEVGSDPLCINSKPW